MYKALDPAKHEIRVLLLLPDRDIDATIQCQLVYASLDDEDLQYEALSYGWGDPEPAQDIEVDGTACQVGPNLHSALRRLRSKDAIRRLWVDALCINQKHNGEKSHQVAQMGRIFTGATQTNAWLGEHNDGELAMDLAKEIHETTTVEQLERLCNDESRSGSWVSLFWVATTMHTDNGPFDAGSVVGTDRMERILEKNVDNTRGGA